MPEEPKDKEYHIGQKAWIEHLNDDKSFQGKVERVLFGSEEEKAKGMVEKVDEIHAIVMKNVNKKGAIREMFMGVRGLATLLTAIVIILGIIKGWFVALLAYFFHK